MSKTVLEQTANKIAISRAKDEYLKWGGYYSVISNENEMIKKEYLKNIAEDIILKDIVPRYNIKNSSVIKDLFYYIVSNATTLLNYSNLAKKLGIDAKMIKQYIEYFEENFLISTIPNYHNKLTQQIKSAKKLYITDNGFLNLGINRNKNLGNKLENFVFNELFKLNDDLTYINDTYEIDFKTKDTLYQVAFDIEDEKTLKRELNSFKHFCKESYKCKLITYNTNTKFDNIEVLSFEEFVFNKF